MRSERLRPHSVQGIRDLGIRPFFTTKGVGRGSGQGLTIARWVVVERHSGSLDFETAERAGTRFFARSSLVVARLTAAPASQHS